MGSDPEALKISARNAGRIIQVFKRPTFGKSDSLYYTPNASHALTAPAHSLMRDRRECSEFSRQNPYDIENSGMPKAEDGSVRT